MSQAAGRLGQPTIMGDCHKCGGERQIHHIGTAWHCRECGTQIMVPGQHAEPCTGCLLLEVRVAALETQVLKLMQARP